MAHIDWKKELDAIQVQPASPGLDLPLTAELIRAKARAKGPKAIKDLQVAIDSGAYINVASALLITELGLPILPLDSLEPILP